MTTKHYDRDLDAHVRAAVMENAQFLMSPEGGALCLEHAARRVGLTPSALEKRLRPKDEA